MEVLNVVWGVVLLLLYAIVLRVLIVRFFGLRLTDWLGYIFCVAALVAGPTRLWDIAPWLLWGLPIMAVIAMVQSLSQRRGRRLKSAWAMKVVKS